CRGLQAVDELVDRKAVGDLLQRSEQAEHPLGHPFLVLHRLRADLGPLLGRRLVHAGEGGGPGPHSRANSARTSLAATRRSSASRSSPMSSRSSRGGGKYSSSSVM